MDALYPSGDAFSKTTSAQGLRNEREARGGINKEGQKNSLADAVARKKSLTICSLEMITKMTKSNALTKVSYSVVVLEEYLLADPL